MNLSKLIDKNVNKAFNIVDGLMITAVFHLKDVTGFNYNTKQVTVANPSDVQVRALVIESKKKDDSVQYKNLLVKSTPLKNLDMYDKCTIGSQVWTIGEPIVDTGSIQLIEVFRNG